MKASFSYLLLLLVPSAFVVAAERNFVSDLSPVPVITASRALRAYVTESQANPSKTLSAELTIVLLSEKLVVERCHAMHQKDPRTRDAVLSALDELEKGIDQLLRHLSAGTEKLDEERLKELRAPFYAAVADFRLRLKTSFFQ